MTTNNEPATIIYVDADACPVKAEILKVAERHGLPVVIVSNSGMRPSRDPLVRHVVVSASFDAADNWIAEHAAAGDIAVTADVPLADRCVKAGARVVAPTGRAFTESSIGSDLAMRNLMTGLRETGQIRGGGRPFTKADRSRFLQALDQAVQALRRRST